jgi:hypothetical protein
MTLGVLYLLLYIDIISGPIYLILVLESVIIDMLRTSTVIEASNEM